MEEGETTLPRGNEIFHFNDALSEQQTYTSSEKFHLKEGETMLAQGNEICFDFNFNDALSEQHTYSSSENFHLEEGETMLARRKENFFVPRASMVSPSSK